MKTLRKELYNILDMPRGETKWGLVYNKCMMVVIVLSILPLMFKLDHSMLFEPKYAALYYLDKFAAAIFIFDYLLRWITADFKLRQGRLSFLFYPFTVFALVDLLSILPSLNIVNSAFRLFKVFRIFRALRVFKFLRYLKSIEIVARVVRRERAALVSVVLLAIGYILVSGLIMFSVEPQSFSTFFDAVYWAATALTTVGYGDICPQTYGGRMVSMVSSLFGIAFIALPSGILTAGFMEEFKKRGSKH